jgi:hypothetical protein
MQSKLSLLLHVPLSKHVEFDSPSSAFWYPFRQENVTFEPTPNRTLSLPAVLNTEEMLIAPNETFTCGHVATTRDVQLTNSHVSLDEQNQVDDVMVILGVELLPAH